MDQNARLLSSPFVRTEGSRLLSYAAQAMAGALKSMAGPVLVAAALLFAGAIRVQAQNPATSVAVDANANQHPINPNIYGIGGISDTSDIKALNVTLNRIGGNNESDYNWQQDAINLDADWYFESYLMDGPPVVPGAGTDNTIQNTYNANVGAEPMVTIPMLPYIAKVQSNATSSAASLWSYSIAKYGAQVACGSLAANDPYQTDAGSGCLANGSDVVNDPTDAYVANSVSIQTGYVQHLISKWGLSTTSTGIKYYLLDNEPSLWNGTHRDVHPNPETYQEEYNNIVAYATAIRSLDPNAKIVGPEEWTWWAMWEDGLDQKNGTGSGSDYATHSDTYYYPWLLKQLYAYQQSSGIKMLDVLSVHCYDDGGAAANIETRELWDPSYVDPGWEGSGGIDINGGILDWIPLMKQWVNQYYPGLEIGCTEYSWGNDNSLTGATEQADVLGIFGLYGFDLATNWGAPPKPGYLAMQMYRNYDGNLSTFGDTSVSAQVADPDNLSAFAALRSSDGALTVMVINKQTGTTPVTVSLANFGTTGTAQAYQISSASQTAINSLGSVAVSNNAISFTAPSQSVTLFVIASGSVTSAPTAPTGLAASVGNGTATLTWNAGGGATSYTLSRGSSSSGPFAPIATVTSPAPTTYTNTGLINGTTYYYVVSGTNAAGTSANSSAVAATPLVPPTFTSSASASPNPAVQNSNTTVTASVKCTANTLMNGGVQIIAVDPSGNATTLKSFTGQNFTSNQTQTYTATLTPALVGTYTLEVEVTSATGQQWSLNSNAGSVTVSSALSFTSTGTATPSSVAIGATTTIDITVKNTGTVAYSNGNVEVQIFNASGTAVVTQVYSSQNIAAGSSQSYSFTWTPDSSTATGTYSVDVGAFDSSWSTDYYWNTDATITVTSGTTVAA
ncbi:MAG TPA: glycoside hydrolase family 44 protein, partial [Terracidiphilus sp.]|nr:glycoside hydrolase family 44 protein [Terracidiphilus sp.]